MLCMCSSMTDWINLCTELSVAYYARKIDEEEYYKELKLLLLQHAGAQPDLGLCYTEREFSRQQISLRSTSSLHVSSFTLQGIDTFSSTKTCLYNSDPLEPHFYIVKLEFTGVYIIFSYFCSKT